MPVVSLAEVLVAPVLNGSQKAMEKQLGPAAAKAGRKAGSQMGEGLAEGLASETKGLETEYARLGKAVTTAQDKVTASRKRSEAAAEAEKKALGAVRVAELQLAETRENGRAKASQIAAAEERLSAARSRATASSRAHQAAERDLASTTDDLGTAQHLAARASEELETHLRRVQQESAKTERSTGRLGALLNRSFRGRPLADIARSIREDSSRIDFDLHKMAQSVSQQGTRGGRAFTQGFAVVSAGLAIVPPVAGAAGSALLAASGSAATLVGSIKDLAGVSALAPAALIAVGAGAGVLRAAFSGVGEALKEFNDLAKTPVSAGVNPRIQAMAVEDAQRSIADAQQAAALVRVRSARRIEDAQRALADAEDAAAEAAEDSAEAQVQAARRVEDARRSLQDTIDMVSEQQRDAARSVELAERSEAEAARDVIRAQQDLVEAREEAANRVNAVGAALEGANERAADTAAAYRQAVALYNSATAEPSSAPSRVSQLRDTVARLAAADADAQKAAAELREEQGKAQKEAEAGGEAILAAEERLADARQAEADAVRARQEAQADAVKQQLDGDRAVQDAHEAVTDALKEQDRAASDAAKSAVDGARRVADAQRDVEDAVQESGHAQVDAARAVTDAQRNLERVQLQQGDVAEQAGAKSQAALDRLTPSARTAVLALLGIYEQLGSIRRIAQENFFTGFTVPLERLAATVLPQLATGVGAIATAFGGGAQQLMTSLADALGGGVLEGLLLTVAASIGILNGAIDPIVQSFVTLGVVGMDYMPGLAGAIRDLAAQFNTFIQGAAADGSLRGWIDAGLQGFRDLASILGSVSGIFGAIADAARAGGIDTTLGSVANNLDRIEAVMKGPVFQETMATIFAGAAAGARGLASALGPIGEAFRTGAPALADFLRLGGEIAGLFIGGIFTAFSDPAFGVGLTTFMEALRTATADIVPLLPGLAASLGDVLVAIAPIAAALGPTVVEVLTIFASALSSIVGALSPLLTAMAESPLIVGLFIAALSATAGVSALLTFAGNIQKITGGFGLMGRLIPLLLNPIGLAIAAVVALVGATVWFFTQTEAGRAVIDSLVAFFGQVFFGFLRFMREDFWPGLARVLQSFQDGATNAASWVLGKVQGLRDGISTAASNIGGFFDGMRDALGKVPGAFTSMVTGALSEFDKLKSAAKEPIRVVVEKVINEGLLGAFNSIPGVEIKPLSLPKGFYTGGYTGDIDPRKAAGVVHGREFVFTAAQTAALGKENLASMAHAAVRGNAGGAATAGHGNIGGFFEGNAAAIRRHGAYFMDVARGMDGWNFGGAAQLWDGAAGVKVAVGKGQLQGRVSPLERGGGILGYTTGNNIDMSPSWMARLAPKQRLTVAAHEVGHALGLPHNSLNSIMQPNLANMAATPTAVDIRNLQALYPGGSGKAGSAESNPFDGLIDGLMGQFKAMFPAGGMFVDVAGGLAKTGLGQVVQWVSDIKDGIKNIAGNVVDSIRGFFGGGASTADDALYRDEGGWLPPGVHRVRNDTGQNEAILNPQQWRDIHMLATNRTVEAPAFPGTVRLLVGEREFTAYVDQRVGAGITERVSVMNGRRAGR